jgi:hypothetical protein
MNHNHTEKFKQLLDEGETVFQFHPKLFSWIKDKFPQSKIIGVIEVGCEDDSCPITETIVTLSDSKEIRIGREKEKISKIDVQLAFQKQFLNQNP